jgi:hypothetical protein
VHRIIHEVFSSFIKINWGCELTHRKSCRQSARKRAIVWPFQLNQNQLIPNSSTQKMLIERESGCCRSGSGHFKYFVCVCVWMYVCMNGKEAEKSIVSGDSFFLGKIRSCFLRRDEDRVRERDECLNTQNHNPSIHSLGHTKYPSSPFLFPYLFLANSIYEAVFYC